MESIKDTLALSKLNNVINDNKYVNTNDKHVKKNYALNRDKFIPNTEESMLAEEIAVTLMDLDNFAFYFSVVKKIGVGTAMILLKTVLSDVEEKKGTKYPVRDIKKYFTWKYRRRLY
jgi:hypothetical protein